MENEKLQYTQNIQHYEFILSNIYEQQTKADNKASIFITFCIAIIGFVITLETITFITKSLIIFGLFISIVFFIMVLIPRKTLDEKNKPPKSDDENGINIYYYSDISSIDEKEFVSTYSKMDNEFFITRIMTQIHINSKIVVKKNKWVERGIYCTATVLFCGYVSMLLMNLVSIIVTLLFVIWDLILVFIF